MKEFKDYFSKSEIVLWSSSVMVIIISFCVFDRINYMTLCASLIGVTSLIFNAKGNPFGQLLMVVFSLLYGIISYTFSYYGEMITYLGMTMPMAIFALISWLKNPYNGNKAEVKVNSIGKSACAKQLANLIRGMGAHVNLIPINPVDGSPYSATDAANVHRFQQKLESLGVNATVRRRLGSEISAACGQLRRDEMNGKA